eukprot:gnl/TRDRNA2_/TRDRNA2_157158_c1_seq3.p1 gnl/TRDRNA2_/TRDRNA2_157158_c1~~gnl/TRDRNA2_/TRDRNA2_157158_c1_seq3.p1  ORF type:complete len:142 (+),score=15.85 gnl/TRDRNA2_/TRDRNA2_157158_c1_seq3:3-428(+)
MQRQCFFLAVQLKALLGYTIELENIMDSVGKEPQQTRPTEHVARHSQNQPEIGRFTSSQMAESWQAGARLGMSSVREVLKDSESLFRDFDEKLYTLNVQSNIRTYSKYRGCFGRLLGLKLPRPCATITHQPIDGQNAEMAC